MVESSKAGFDCFVSNEVHCSSLWAWSNVRGRILRRASRRPVFDPSVAATCGHVPIGKWTEVAGTIDSSAARLGGGMPRM